MAACMLRERGAERADLNRCNLRSRRRTGWCKFSAPFVLSEALLLGLLSPNRRNVEA
jgi:hypothetical protein